MAAGCLRGWLRDGARLRLRSPDNTFYAYELTDAAAHGSLDLTLSYSRHAPPGHDPAAINTERFGG